MLSDKGAGLATLAGGAGAGEGLLGIGEAGTGAALAEGFPLPPFSLAKTLSGLPF